MHHGAIKSAADALEDILEASHEHFGGYKKEPFINIDNTPKHLLHMTPEDLKPKSRAQEREEF